MTPYSIADGGGLERQQRRVSTTKRFFSHPNRSGLTSRSGLSSKASQGQGFESGASSYKAGSYRKFFLLVWLKQRLFENHIIVKTLRLTQKKSLPDALQSKVTKTLQFVTVISYSDTIVSYLSVPCMIRQEIKSLSNVIFTYRKKFKV